MISQTPRHSFEEFHLYAASVRDDIEQSLAQYLPLSPVSINERFNQALNYALFPGGKRVRPMLTLLGSQIVGPTDQNLLAAATAVEYIHTSSIILDDLPCMDNARERRERACLHKQFGEGLAILIALALLNASYELVINSCPTDKTKALRAHQELVKCVGTQGMVIGQALDIDNGMPAFKRSAAELDSVRDLKTSSLIRFAINLGAILSDASHEQVAVLSHFAELLGSAYQAKDDLLDVEEDRASANGTRESGLKSSRVGGRLEQLTEEAKSSIIAKFGPTPPTLLLCQVADFIATRNR